MMTKQYFSRLSEIGVISVYRSIVLIFLLLLLLIIPNTSSFAEEVTEIMPSYKYEDFVTYLELSQEGELADVFLHTINIANCQKLNLSVHSLFEEFPGYNVVRELPTNEETYVSKYEKYVVYNLEDESTLFIFIEDDILTTVCRMMPRCSAEEFASIEQEVSSPGDVVGIDENAVFNPFIQWGPVSYHCLNDGTFKQITYTQLAHSPDEFVVKDIVTISQDACLSVLRDIYPEDMPSKR